MSANQVAREGAWLEAIGLFQQVRSGDHPAARRLLHSSSDPDAVTECLLRMLAVFLRAEDGEKLDHFVDVAFKVGPPPAA
ncbi:hypothetical protein [Pseudonocardia phyllosphaerae]|uniref:hypothetical protein n=1 Tax=Pseudonocardia phyllosphaerae TaxID=3390502 RepID=UPI003979585E